MKITQDLKDGILLIKIISEIPLNALKTMKAMKKLLVQVIMILIKFNIQKRPIPCLNLIIEMKIFI